MPRQIIDSDSGDKKFDARVHIRNNRGQIVQVKPYKLTVRDGLPIYQDEKGFYYADGSDVPMSQLILHGYVKQPEKKVAAAPQPQTQAPQVAVVTEAPSPAPAAEESAPEGVIPEESDENPEPPASDDQGTTGL
jgi:hypothetical protein